MERKAKSRTAVLTAIILILLSVLALRLFQMQIVEADERTSASSAASTYTWYTTVQAARGEILDSNGNVLVYNRTTYSLTINNFVLFNSDDPNGSLLALADLCEELGVDYADHLPISESRPYTSTLDDYSSSWQDFFRAWLEYRDWDPDISPDNLMKLMRDQFHIPEDWSDSDARKVIGLRYELDLRYATNLSTYTLAEDIDSDVLAELLELNVPGMMVATGSARCYNTTYCAQLLGRVGKITAEQYDYYQELGYSMDAYVGQDGVEAAFEEQLHGTDGTLRTTVDASGNILEQVYTTLPQAGQNVELTINNRLQSAAEESLADIIEYLHENGAGNTGEGTDAEGGAMVVMDVNTGEVLACASYPTYDPSTYNEDFNELVSDELAPLYDRALLAEYIPGSTFKMVTAIAAIESGTMGRYYEIVDQGLYTYYDDFQPACMIWTSSRSTHGTINMMQALSYSCNYYFYECARLTGIDNIDKYAEQLGLGQPTGIELAESSGVLASPETRKELHEGEEANWHPADTLQTGIGQNDNAFTPIQLCAYVSQLATGGVRYRATIMKRVLSSDFTTVVEENEPEVVSDMQLSAEAVACVHEGMEMCTTSGTAASYFTNYPISVAAKTGTAQHGGGGSDNAAFVCYAPADDPQIAIVVYVEKGAQGGQLSSAAKAVMDVYFDTEVTVETAGGEYEIQ